MPYDYEVLVDEKFIVQTNDSAVALTMWGKAFRELHKYKSIELRSIARNEYVKITFDKNRITDGISMMDCKFTLDGDMICCTGPNHIDLASSPTGFGKSDIEAYKDYQVDCLGDENERE